MSKQNKFTPKAILVPTISLLVIAGVVTLLLALTNFITQDKIEQQNIQKVNDSCKVVLPSATSFEENTLDNTVYYLGKDENSNPVGYAIISSEKGYGGPVEVMTGITTDNSISGVVILSESETPGLGANAEKDEFRDQYKTCVPDSGFSVTKSSPNDGEIQAMTGATITSTAVTKAVNDSLSVYEQIKEVN